MAEPSERIKAHIVDAQYFIDRLGYDIGLTQDECTAYQAFPHYHRDFFEMIIRSHRHAFPPNALKGYLGLLCGNEEGNNWAEFSQLLFMRYQLVSKRVARCMSVDDVASLLFPLAGFNHLQPAFIEKITDALSVEGDICVEDVYKLHPDKLPMFCYLGFEVWKHYLNDKQAPLSRPPVEKNTPNPHAKPPEQRQAILNKIYDEGWQPLALPSGAKTHLSHWYINTFFKAEGTFNDRWKELRKEELIRNASES